MSVSPFQGRLLNRLPRGGSGLTGDLGASGQFFFFLGGACGEVGTGRAKEAGRGVGWVLMRGPEEATGGREALAGRAAPAPAPPGLIGFVSGPARGCQLSPRARSPGAGGAGRRAWGWGAEEGGLRLPCSDSSLPLLGTKLLWGFSA